jgi:hypothetical protein
MTSIQRLPGGRIPTIFCESIAQAIVAGVATHTLNEACRRVGILPGTAHAWLRRGRRDRGRGRESGYRRFVEALEEVRRGAGIPHGSGAGDSR